MRASLLTTTALVAVSFTQPVTAQTIGGGVGGAGDYPTTTQFGGAAGGNGGVGPNGGAGAAGSDRVQASAGTSGAGGGGGGAGGGVGGKGGLDGTGDGTAGAGGATAGADGGAGGTFSGGGGGAGGANGASVSSNGDIIQAGDGGAGGAGAGDAAVNLYGGGGGGGEGGYGQVVGGDGFTNTSGGKVIGGTGGAGGSGFQGGAGGSGGVGVYLTAGGTLSNAGLVSGGTGGVGGMQAPSDIYATPIAGAGGAGDAGVSALSGGSVTNSGTISGGNGAAAGADGNLAPAGVGGVGITGSGLTLINSGAISGGLANAGATGAARADAIDFTGGDNVLTLQGGSTILGDIGTAGTVTLNQTTAQTLANIVKGTGTLIDSGTGTLTLTGANTYTGGTTLSAGTLNVGSTGALGSVGLISFAGGTLQYSAANQTDYSSRFLNAANQAYKIDTNGQTVIFGSALVSTGGNLTVSGGGRLVLSSTGNNWTGVTTVSAGTLQGTTSTISGGSVVDNATLAFVQPTSGTFAQAVSGTGTVTVSGLGAGQAVTFSGALTNAGGISVADSSGVAIAATGSVAAGATGILLSGTGGTVNNQGSIASSATVSSNGINVTGSGATITNGAVGNTAASITGTNGGIYMTGSATVTNYGTITASGGPGSNQDAVSDQTGVLTLNNYGTIRSLGFNSGVFSAVAGSKINNYAGATITGGATTVGGYGVNFTGGTLYNAGTITKGAQATIAIIANGASTITNATGGTITGTVQAAGLTLYNAGSMGAIAATGPDSHSIGLYAGSSTGAVTLGSGNDTVALYTGTGAASTALLDPAGSNQTLVMAGTHGAATVTSLSLGAGANTVTLNGTGDGATNGAAGSLALDTVSGAASITKNDAGTWTLTGATGSPNAAIIANGGTLIFAGSGQTGGITVSGGTIRATGTGSFGAANITSTGGAIQYGATGTYANAIALGAAGGATLFQTYSPSEALTATLSGPITQTSGLQSVEFGLAGGATAGTFVLGGTNNSWGGTTTVDAGVTLQGISSAISGSSVTDNGAIVFAEGTGTNRTFATPISGTGSVTKQGGNTLTLSGANTFSGGLTISAGTVQGTVLATGSGSFGSGAIVDNATLLISQGLTGNLHNTVSGSGGITVQGLGIGQSLIFQGALTNAGGVTVADGSTITNTSTNSITAGAQAVTLNGAGATLNNYGAIAGSTTGGSNGVAVNAAATIVNGAVGNTTASITGTNAGVYANTDATITNYGTISSGALGANQDGISARGGTLAVNNYGTIRSLGLNAGVYDGAAGAVIANFAGGTISGGTTSTAGTAYAVHIQTGTLLNAGTLNAGVNPTPGALATTEAVRSEGTLTLGNSGTINGAVTAATAITAYNGGAMGNVTVIGAGSSGLALFAGSSTGDITLANGDDTVTLYTGTGAASTGYSYNLTTGTVAAGTTADATHIVVQTAGAHDAASVGAIALGSGANTLALAGGGNGSDTTGAAGSIDLSTVTGAGTIAKTGTGTWTLSGASASPAATIDAGAGSPAGLLVFDGTTGLTGAINVNGATIRATTAGAFGTGTITTIDPTVQFAATGHYANAISLDASDPTILQTYGTDSDGNAIVATLDGTISEAQANQPITFSSIATDGSAIPGTIVLTSDQNSWTGVTTIADQTVLQGTTATISGGSVVDNGTLAFVQAGAGSFASDVSGTGGISVAGVTAGDPAVFTPAALTLAGALTNSGGILVADGSGLTLTGAGSTSTGSGITLAGDDAALTIGAGGSYAVTADGGVAVTASGADTTVAILGGVVDGDGNFTPAGQVSGEGGGVLLAGLSATVNNAGQITGAGAGSYGIRATAGSATIDNAASASILGTDYGIDSSGGALTIDNSGGIEGQVAAIRSVGDFDDVVTLRTGSTTAGLVSLGGGNDTLTIETGALVGPVDGGAGANTLVLDGAGTGANAGSLDMGMVSNFGSRAKNGTGTFTLTGTDATTAPWTINAGTLATGGAAISSGSAVTVNAAGTLALLANQTIGSLSGAGAVTLNSYTLTTGGDDTDTEFSGVASGTGGLTKTGTGVLTLSGANTYTGATTVADGTLRLSADDVLSDGTALSVLNGATLDLNGHSDTVASFDLAGTLTGGGTLTANAYNLYGGTVDMGLGAGALNQVSGTTVLNSQTSASPVTVLGGTLQLGASDRLADTATVNVNAGGTLDLQGFSDTVGSLELAGTLAGTGTLTATSYRLTGGTVDANLGTGTLTQASGTSTLNGTAAAQTVNVDAGTLVFGAANRLSNTAALSVSPGGVIDLASFDQTVGTAAIGGTLAGTGTLNATSYSLFGATIEANLGAGTVTVGTGTTVLDGTSAAGTVQIGGTLALGASDRLSNTAALTVAQGGTLDLAGFDQTVGTAAIAGHLAGTGTLTTAEYDLSGATIDANLGAGTLVVDAGTSTLNGTAAAGTVQIGGTLALGASNRLSNAAALIVAQGGTLDLATFDQSVGTAAISGRLAGTGTLTATSYALSGATIDGNLGTGTMTVGSGTTTLNGTSAASTVQIGGTLALGASDRLASNASLALTQGGTLALAGFQQTVGSLSGAGGTIALGSGHLTVNETATDEYDGTITGTGGLTKSGAGRLILGGANTYTGATLVTDGILSVNGSLASTVTVSGNGHVGGNGSIGTLAIAAGGILAPGNSIGTLNVNGNLTIASGAFYDVETSPTAADRTNVTGTATLSGGTVRVLAGGTGYSPLTRFVILDANGGVSGLFSGVTSNMAFLSPTLEYAANTVTLALRRNDVAFTAMAQTPNQRAVASALQALPLTGTLPTAVLPLSATQARGAFDALSGENYAAIPSALIDEGRHVREALLLDAQRAGEGFGVWGDAVDDSGKFDRSQSLGTDALNSHRQGIIGGIDYGHDGFRASVASGYSDGTYHEFARGARTGIKSYYAGGAVDYRAGAFRIEAGGAYSWHTLETSRSVDFASFQDLTHSRQHANTTQGFAEAGYTLFSGETVKIEPFVGYTYLRASVDPTTETGGAAALSVARVKRDLDFARAGIHLTGEVPVADSGAVFMPRLSLAYQRGWGDRTGTATVALAGAAPFEVVGATLPRNAAQMDGGFDIAMGKLRLGASYVGTVGDHQFDHGAKVTFGIRF